jgi:hypothetical protein
MRPKNKIASLNHKAIVSNTQSVGFHNPLVRHVRCANPAAGLPEQKIIKK